MNSLQNLDQATLHIRDMDSADLVQVMVIESNAHVSPWARLSFEESLTKNYSCQVVEHGASNEVVAYFVVCPVVDELHILNIAVAPQCQGLGLGHMVMQGIVDLANGHALRKIFLEVRASNDIAKSLYLKWQFTQIAIRKRYYSVVHSSNSSEREDALVFVRQLPSQQNK